ncbi:nitroreductase [Tsukamurella pulmonis]|uniref:Nitroreductase n=1 Tax=Tsukamurella pulmonis TaxID=47312 RepID=A0A1H1CBU5_9ACTN|nr:nitroreductase family protein [Tsukamurella pulmonis]KXO89976.1 nitroreductase [Tsukamurella pulmonis]KXP11232.1 nitroreductase [Tsukamurella pulmonis]RDH12861.1 nitroreductase [Tsukamurella pulmonis]SDQ61578.1 Nitroreductase [Tsukamurella pulmonis]SUP23922.1 F420-0--gamma-glutamyl ligase [Tsukamurella pulmonis]
MPDPIPSTDDALARLAAMPLVEAMATQRAIRRVLPDPVDDALVLRCIEAAERAPTGQNGQQWEFVVVKDARLKHRLGRQYRLCWGAYWRAVYRREAAADDAKARMARAVQWQVDHFGEIPVLVVACLRLGVGEGRVPLVRMPHVAESGYWGSVYPAVQNLLLTARAMGLGASLVTMPLWNLLAARRILGLPANVTPICVMPLGWPRGRYGPSARKPVGEVTHLDGYGRRHWLEADS